MAHVDRIYQPTTDDISWAATHQPTSVLVVGRPTQPLIDTIATLGAEARTTDPMFGKLLRRGTYLVETPDGWVMILSTGGEAAPAEQAAERDASGHLGSAASLFDTLWPEATPMAGSCLFERGDHVRPRGERRVGTVTRTVLLGSTYDVQVRVDGRTRTYAETDLDLVAGDPEDPSFWVTDEPGTAREIALTLTHTKLRNPLSDVLYSFSASKTVFRPYQFVPVLKLLNSPSGRLLIADEVGLGKTIEAGLIWTELEQRERLRRVLVLSPAALVHKWRAEMRRRFDRKLEVVDLAGMREFAQHVHEGRDEPLQAVMSFQALRQATDVLQKLSDVNPRFDLVIVDEAHAMRNKGTSTHELGRLLSDWADTLVFLTATPLNLGRNDLFNLMNLLDGEQFDDPYVFSSQLEPNRVLNDVLRQINSPSNDEPRQLAARLDEIHGLELGESVTARPDFASLQALLSRDTPLSLGERARAKRLIGELNTLSSVFTRTRKVDVPDAKAQREARQIDVVWTPEESSFYSSVRKLYFARARSQGVPLGFAMQMPLRQAASCIPAMQRMLGRTDFDDVRVQILDDEDDAYGVPVDELSAEDYMEVRRLHRPMATDSKFEALRTRLVEARSQDLRQAMVFSFFTGTLSYLSERLRSDFSVKVMTGKTPMKEREAIMDDFRAGKFELLLLSQVGSEGLDFEFCNVLVNYDMPWNPMQVEQRIGRLDRFGQQHDKIFIYNMHIPGTIETDIFERLYHRIGVFKDSIGELEPILRDGMDQWTKDLMDPRLSEAQRVAQTDRVAVALEERKLQVEQLGESSALLSTPDLLEIDGMTSAGPSDGRYVGAAELRALLELVVERHGGRLSTTDSEGRFVLRGNHDMATALTSSGVPRQGSMYSFQHLSGLLRDEEEIVATFASDTASRHNVELISSRHPLVHLALELLEEDAFSQRRFGTVGVPGLERGRRWVVRLDLVETTGVRPRTELWATALDLASRQPSGDVEGPLLSALAEGTLTEATHRETSLPLDLIELHLAERRRRVAEERQQDNAAIVGGRMASRSQGFDRKIRRARETLVEMQRTRGDERILRMHEGRIRNLTSDRDEVLARLAARKDLTVANHPVAVLVVEGLGTT